MLEDDCTFVGTELLTPRVDLGGGVASPRASSSLVDGEGRQLRRRKLKSPATTKKKILVSPKLSPLPKKKKSQSRTQSKPGPSKSNKPQVRKTRKKSKSKLSKQKSKSRSKSSSKKNQASAKRKQVGSRSKSPPRPKKKEGSKSKAIKPKSKSQSRGASRDSRGLPSDRSRVVYHLRSARRAQPDSSRTPEHSKPRERKASGVGAFYFSKSSEEPRPESRGARPEKGITPASSAEFLETRK